MVEIKAGARLRGSNCGTEVVVVRAASENIQLSCCDAKMIGIHETPAAFVPVASRQQILVGKRYEDADLGLELLCTKAGPGPLAAAGRELVIKVANALPSSD